MIEETTTCPNCYGLKCGCNISKCKPMSYPNMKVCSNYNSSDLKYCHDCCAICGFCKGTGVVGWIDKLFFIQNSIYNDPITPNSILIMDNFYEIKLYIIGHLDYKNFWKTRIDKDDISKESIREYFSNLTKDYII